MNPNHFEKLSNTVGEQQSHEQKFYESDKFRQRLEALEAIVKNFSQSELDKNAAKREQLANLINFYNTEEGREYFANHLAWSGNSDDPKIVELAIKSDERRLHEDYAADIADVFGISNDRKQKIKENIESYKIQYKEAEGLFNQYYLEREQRDSLILKEAQVQGYGLNLESAMRALDEGRYDLAVVILLGLPLEELKDDHPFVKELFGGLPSSFAAATKNHRIPHLCAWARRYNPGALVELKRRTDEYAKFWDNLSPLRRHHSENMVPEYSYLGDWDEASKRAEANPSSFRSHNSPEELAKMHELLLELTSEDLRPLRSKEELRAKIEK